MHNIKIRWADSDMEMNNLALIKKTLQATSLRQEVIASNITNVNTDEYKRNQVDFESLLHDAKRGLSLNKTQPNHFGVGNINDLKPSVTKVTDTIVKENGNNVDLDIEMVNLSQNALHYQALISQLNSQYSRMATVISK